MRDNHSLKAPGLLDTAGRIAIGIPRLNIIDRRPDESVDSHQIDKIGHQKSPLLFCTHHMATDLRYLPSAFTLGTYVHDALHSASCSPHFHIHLIPSPDFHSHDKPDLRGWTQTISPPTTIASSKDQRKQESDLVMRCWQMRQRTV